MLVEPNTLSEAQWRELEEIIRTTRDIKVYRRAKVVLFRNAGYTTDEIQEYIDYSERAQQYWLSRYREEGVSGLYERPRSGRPKQHVKQDVDQSVRQDSEQDVEQDVKQDSEQETADSVSKLGDGVRVSLESMSKYHPKRYLRDRAKMVILRDAGYSASEIARKLDVRMIAHAAVPGVQRADHANLSPKPFRIQSERLQGVG